MLGWMMMCLMLPPPPNDCSLIYQVILSNTFHKIIQSLEIEVAILARRQSRPLLFQEILSSRWWYQ